MSDIIFFSILSGLSFIAVLMRAFWRAFDLPLIG